MIAERVGKMENWSVQKCEREMDYACQFGVCASLLECVCVCGCGGVWVCGCVDGCAYLYFVCVWVWVKLRVCLCGYGWMHTHIYQIVCLCICAHLISEYVCAYARSHFFVRVHIPVSAYRRILKALICNNSFAPTPLKNETGLKVKRWTFYLSQEDGKNDKLLCCESRVRNLLKFLLVCVAEK